MASGRRPNLLKKIAQIYVRFRIVRPQGQGELVWRIASSAWPVAASAKATDFYFRVGGIERQGQLIFLNAFEGRPTRPRAVAKLLCTRALDGTAATSLRQRRPSVWYC